VASQHDQLVSGSVSWYFFEFCLAFKFPLLCNVARELCVRFSYCVQFVRLCYLELQLSVWYLKHHPLLFALLSWNSQFISLFYFLNWWVIFILY
jgi:hypothetical protein